MPKAKQAKLYARKRVCICCGLEQSWSTEITKDARVLSIAPQMYVRGATRHIKMGRAVTICEDCFVLAVAGPGTRRAGELSEGLYESLRSLYNAITEEPD